MKATLCLALFVCLVILHSPAQELKKKEVKRALEKGSVENLVLIIGDQFTPGFNSEFDLELTLAGGAKVLASDYSVVWDYTNVVVDNVPFKIKGEFLANGKGVLKPRDPAAYYPNIPAKITVELAGKKVEKVLTPLHCYPNFLTARAGEDGISGDNGSSGYSNGSSGRSGGRGRMGERGPDIAIELSEETIDGKLHLILTIDGKKYPLDPTCSKVSIASRGGKGGDGGNGGNGANGNKDTKGKYTGSGGNGGNGGDGGDGGDGGNITVTGSVYEKYKDVVTFTSTGGGGGRAGRGGRSGSGSSSGLSGSRGSEGTKGNPGQVIFKN